MHGVNSTPLNATDDSIMPAKPACYQPRSLTAVSYKVGGAPSGGMAVVVKATSPTMLFGVHSNNQTSKTAPLVDFVQESENDFTTGFCHVSKAIKQQHYRFSNNLLWPLAHSMPIPKNITAVKLEELFADYMRYCDQQNTALLTYAEGERKLTAQDQIWVHDYQSVGVTGSVFSWHIPFPKLDYLQQTEIAHSKEQPHTRTSLINTKVFAQYMALFGTAALITFQRQADLINFVMTQDCLHQQRGDHTLSAHYPNHLDISQTGDLPKIRAYLLANFSAGELFATTLNGRRTSLLCVPVGRDVHATFQAAQLGEFETVYDGDDKAALFRGITTTSGQHKTPEYAEINVSNLDRNHFKDRAPCLADVVKTVAGRDWVLAIHRNDYTKGTRRLLSAYEHYLAQLPEERRQNTTLFLGLQPTRGGVKGYREYAETVLKKVAALQYRFSSDAIVVVPGVRPNDVLRLMRRDEAKVYLCPSFRDGFNLMPSEFIASNFDTPLAKGVITSTGAGNADVIWNGQFGDKRKGAHILPIPDYFSDYNTPKGQEDAAQAIFNGIQFILNPDNTAQVKADFAYMKKRIAHCDAENFNTTVQRHYPRAMQWAFAEDPRFQAMPHYHDSTGKVDWQKLPHIALQSRP